MVREGYVEKVIYKNEDNGYAVFAVEGEDGEDIFVGNLHGVAEGIYVSAEGDYVEHPTYDCSSNSPHVRSRCRMMCSVLRSTSVRAS